MSRASTQCGRARCGTKFSTKQQKSALTVLRRLYRHPAFPLHMIHDRFSTDLRLVDHHADAAWDQLTFACPLRTNLDAFHLPWMVAVTVSYRSLHSRRRRNVGKKASLSCCNHDPVGNPYRSDSTDGYCTADVYLQNGRRHMRV